MDARAMAFRHQILRGVVGSTAHGTGVEAEEDRDELAVFVEPPELVCGLERLDHYVYRDQPEGVRSQAGDLDLTMYSLRRYCRLASDGNPSILLLLWLPDHMCRTPTGDALIEIRSSFVGRVCGERYLGYLRNQKRHLLENQTGNAKRPELVERYGYDTKYAMHAARLGVQGFQMMTERTLSIPVPEPHRALLRDIRHGRTEFSVALEFIELVERRLEEVVSVCDWAPDFNTINLFLARAHRDYWASADPS